MYAALNAIGEVAWCINRPVLDALQHAGDRGMQIGSMPPLADLPLRDPPPGRAFAVERAPKWLRGQLHVTVRRAISRPQWARPGQHLLHHVWAVWDGVPSLGDAVLTDAHWAMSLTCSVAQGRVMRLSKSLPYLCSSRRLRIQMWRMFARHVSHKAAPVAWPPVCSKVRRPCVRAVLPPGDELGALSAQAAQPVGAEDQRRELLAALQLPEHDAGEATVSSFLPVSHLGQGLKPACGSASTVELSRPMLTVMASALCGRLQHSNGLQQICSTYIPLAASGSCSCGSSGFSCGCMQVAQQFRDEPGMWFPHNMDFRGRAYPMPPHLNHLGSDTSRGILQFAEGRALGEHGLEWLYIQVDSSCPHPCCLPIL